MHGIQAQGSLDDCLAFADDLATLANSVDTPEHSQTVNCQAGIKVSGEGKLKHQ